jgi:hypothetical protein
LLDIFPKFLNIHDDATDTFEIINTQALYKYTTQQTATKDGSTNCERERNDQLERGHNARKGSSAFLVTSGAGI